MSKKVLWSLLALVTVIATVLASCGNKPATTTTTETTTSQTTANVAESTAPPVVIPPDTSRSEKPKYGGTITIAGTTDPIAFDDGFSLTVHVSTTTLNLTNDELLQGDWTKGPAGTHEADYLIGGVNNMNLKTGALADSWEIPYRGKIIFHIREGVFWQNKPPTNGRALTIDDVVFTLNRDITTPGGYIKNTYANFSATAVVTGDNAARTVTVECPPGEFATMIVLIPNYFSIFPRDALELFGNMNNWKNSIGTGPFIMTDYVSSSSMTFKRNPNYWEKNPIGPGKGDQLPYVDGVKWLIVPDNATYFAAMRVGKIDGAGGVYSDVKEFLTNPDIKYTQYINDYCYALFMRTDKQDSPFSKLAVRQALTLATDFDKIVNEYYEGKATLLCWPISPIKEFAGAYVPFNELPAETQALFSHNVTKAKELLAQAGYPTGLKVTITCYNYASMTDYLSQIVKMWAEAGVTVTIDAKDYVTYTSLARNRSYNEMIDYTDSSTWWKMLNFAGVSQYNLSYVDDPIVNAALTRALDLIGFDETALAANYKAIVPYVTQQCWAVPVPNPYYYVVWWPWVKNWNGELYVGYWSYPLYMKYRWEDAALKKQMTGYE